MPKKGTKTCAVAAKEKRQKVAESRARREAAIGWRVAHQSNESEYEASCLRHTQFTKIISGSFHQGDQRFINRGIQCSCIVLEALRLSLHKSPISWTRYDIDEIVVNGDSLFSQYMTSSAVPRMLMVNELPRLFERMNEVYELQIFDDHFMTGCINVDSNESELQVSLLHALSSVFKMSNMVIMVFHSVSIGLIKHGKKFYVFDSHSRNDLGLSCADGTAVLTEFESIQNIYYYLQTLFTSMNLQNYEIFEVTAVNLNIKPQVIDNELEDDEEVSCEGMSKMATFEKTEEIGSTNVPTCFRECNFTRLVSGSFHEGDEYFVHAGLQCSCIALEALRLTLHKHPSCWTQYDVDDIIVTGDSNFAECTRGLAVPRMLRVNELPRVFNRNNEAYQLKVFDDQLVVGCINHDSNASEFHAHLFDALTNAFNISSMVFMVFCSLTICLKKDVGKFFIFDSHSRDKSGLCCTDGAAVLIEFESVQCLCNYLLAMFASMNLDNNETFKITPVNLKLLCQVSESDNILVNEVEKKSNLSKIKMAEGRNIKERKRYHTNHAFSQRKREALKRKYKTDSEYAMQMKMRSKQRYKKDKNYADKVLKSSKLRYRMNKEYANNLISRGKQKYKMNNEYSRKLIETMKRKYRSNKEYAAKLIEYGKVKYRNNNEFAYKKREHSKYKYRTNKEFAKSRIEYSKRRYNTDAIFAHQKIDNAKQRYRIKKELACVEQLAKNTQKSKDIQSCIVKFKASCLEGPNYVCTVCHRQLFKKGVSQCKIEVYSEQHLANTEVCITGKYKHKCSTDCQQPCPIKKSSYGKEWICFTCHKYLKSGKMPPQAVANKMELSVIPAELLNLNSLESQLISLVLPFMRIVSLPKGGQLGIHGPSICVPANIRNIQCISSRTCAADAQIIPVKLKRKLQYKGYYAYQKINLTSIKNALLHLRASNEYYKDVDLDVNWVTAVSEELSDNELHENSKNSSSDEQNENYNKQNKTDQLQTIKEKSINNVINMETAADEDKDVEDIPDTIQQQDNAVILDTCWQPTDLSAEPEAIQESYEEIFSVAPCEGNKPISFFKDKTSEQKAFPTLFPTGAFGLHEQRNIKLSLTKYFNARLLNGDGRFAKNTMYIFYAQYVGEHSQISSKLSIALRKSSPMTADGRRISKQLLTSGTHCNDLLKSDAAYRFMQPIRGTPSYWERTLRELFAAIRQLGIPTWFATFSAAEFRWPEIITAIALQHGKIIDFEKLNWSEKCDFLRLNPVTAARMFDHRVQSLIKEVIRAPANPIGMVDDFFYRVEFQARGSPHIHCLFWIKNAPKFGKVDNAEYIKFIDKYNTCRLPDESNESELHKIVTEVQVHSKTHTKSCKPSKNKPCRYGFPKQPAVRTFITNHDNITANEETCIQNIDEDEAKLRLNTIWQALQNIASTESPSFLDILTSVEITNTEYEEAMNCVSKKSKVILKRNINEQWINNYNPNLLLAWNGNTDFQPVLDAYTCIMYILSYISKAEHAMSQLLETTLQEAKNDNLQVKDQLKKLGSAYLTHREVSAQESVYRALSMPLKHFSRESIFVPAHKNCTRMSLPLSQLKRTEESESDECPWMTNIIDRYIARPAHKTFEIMNLAEFASTFRIIKGKSDPKQADDASVSATSKTKFTLQHGLGIIARRTHSKIAVLRYPKFSKEKNPEDYYAVLLKMFLPHRYDMQLKPDKYVTSEDFYTTGCIKLHDTMKLESVLNIVTKNRMTFESNVDEIDRAEAAVMSTTGSFEDAWACLAPGIEEERCNEEMMKNLIDENEDELIASIHEEDWSTNIQNPLTQSINGSTLVQIDSGRQITCMKGELNKLNHDQQEIFYFVRKWCLDKVSGKQRDPIFTFVNGSGGVGKSLLIRCIVSEAGKILEVLSDKVDDVHIVTLAPTGVAAYNVSGSTIHSFFHLPQRMTLPYVPLGECILNTLRCKLGKLSVIIIDEVSMLSTAMLTYIHGRLAQIVQNSAPFGNISILAFGDFHQLPPVKGIALYKSNGFGLWQDHFKIVTLSKIMRQDSAPFAEMLNCLRVLEKGKSLKEEHCKVLEERANVSKPDDALHVFSKNKDVDDHNNQRLEKLSNQIITLRATDLVKCNGKTYKKKSNIATDGLPFEIKIAVGAKVMLVRNIDISNGLVNGAFGIVTAILMNNEQPNLARCICVQFDNPNVGKGLSQESSNTDVPSGSICILPYDEQLCGGHVRRRQFPLKLAFASTIHKV